MADLFSVRAPLLIRYPDGRMEVMVERLPHTEGLVYFRPFWNQLPAEQGVRFVSGEVRGEGPWKVGDAVVTVLGCQGTHPQQAAEYAEWQSYCDQLGDDYPDTDELRQVVEAAGIVPTAS